MELLTVNFNCFCHFFELFLLLGIISWSSPRLPSLFRTAVDFSTYLFNHHVIFLIGNSIIASLFLLCRRNAAAASLSSEDGAFYDNYVEHSEAAAVLDKHDSTDTSPETAEEKQIVVFKEEIVVEIPQRDEVAAAIEKATREIKKFQRTQSEKLERNTRETAAQRELRRSETENSRKSVSCSERFDSEEMERLSSEEFRRTVDAFIDEHRCRRKAKQNWLELDGYKKYQMAC